MPKEVSNIHIRPKISPYTAVLEAWFGFMNVAGYF